MTKRTIYINIIFDQNILEMGNNLNMPNPMEWTKVLSKTRTWGTELITC